MFNITQTVESERTEKLEKKLNSARLQGKKECVNCGFCCSRRTCIPSPDEAKIICKFLGISFKKAFKKYFTIDFMRSTYFLRIVAENNKQYAGTWLPSEATYNEGRCIFLDNENNCLIHPVKPISSKAFNCWEEFDVSIRDETFRQWDDNALQKQFKVNARKIRFGD